MSLYAIAERDFDKVNHLTAGEMSEPVCLVLEWRLKRCGKPDILHVSQAQRQKQSPSYGGDERIFARGRAGVDTRQCGEQGADSYNGE